MNHTNTEVVLTNSQSAASRVWFTFADRNGHTDGIDLLLVDGDGPRIPLGEMVPLIEQLGLKVLDVLSHNVDTDHEWRYRIEVSLPAAQALLPRRSAVIEALTMLAQGVTESDGLNALVIDGGLAWYDILVLRAYVHYLAQLNATYSLSYIEQALVSNATTATLLVKTFTHRFAPEGLDPAEGASETDARGDSVVAAIRDVSSFDHDRILTSLHELIKATLRTNYYDLQLDSRAEPAESDAWTRALSLKIDPSQLSGLTEPRPQFETWVYSPRVEGIHLRFGPVARGGIRWSDRREDFRTEVLGLVRAQVVKNSVIIPVGSKGGFVVKPPRLNYLSMSNTADEARAAYAIYISALLDIVDNYVLTGAGDREHVPPTRVRCYDAPDPYLVVAADKGTATFSDIANDISVRRNYWLGDAFASGGSVGYDHKAMGITARGAWESVKSHFGSIGLDPATSDFAVVGVGDMAGDVFGNGMLLSPHIRLIAAFDHRHIFLDPNPDPTRSFRERQRLSALLESTWADYDTASISAGGGVYPRASKTLTVSPPAAESLAIPPDQPLEMTPDEVIRAILTAPADLLWNGGIGTYVRSRSESESQVADKSNDRVRVCGADLRCRVVAEGGNLGLTQRARIEFARHGGKINTDAIDNSAGVNTSDYEVNIKILLDREVGAGTITPHERDQLLTDQTADVADSVLLDNFRQNLLLHMSELSAIERIRDHQAIVAALEGRGALNRQNDSLPTDGEFSLQAQSQGRLTRPELAVLSAYVKNSLKKELLGTATLEQPWVNALLPKCFPSAISTRFGDRLHEHPLRREILANLLINEIVNFAGITFVHRMQQSTGATLDRVVEATQFARQILGFDVLWESVEGTDRPILTADQISAFRSARSALDNLVSWTLMLPAGEAKRLRTRGLHKLVSRSNDGRSLLPTLLSGVTAAQLDTLRIVPAVLSSLGEWGAEPLEVMNLGLAAWDQLSLSQLIMDIENLPATDVLSARARAVILSDMYGAVHRLLMRIAATAPAGDSSERIRSWLICNGVGDEVFTARLGPSSDHVPTLGTSVVKVHELRALTAT